MNSDQEVVSQKEYPEAIVADKKGRIIYNALQADDPVVLVIYANGEREMLRKSTGKSFLGRFTPGEFRSPACPHCGEAL